MNKKKCIIASFFASALMLAHPASALELGWTAEPMSASGDTIRTDGDVVFAYCGGPTDLETFTVNGVQFTSVCKLDSIPSSLKPFPFSVQKNIYMDAKGMGTEGVESEDYGHLLEKGWWLNEKGEYTYKITGLEPHHIYLVQLTFHDPHINTARKVYAPDGQRVHVGYGPYIPASEECSEIWKYGGTLVNVFQPAGDTYTFTLTYGDNDNRALFNSIQLRHISGGGPVVSDPSVGSASVKAVGNTATVSLKNVQMGTDEEAVPATAYSVYYKLNGGESVLALENQTAASVDFTIESLEDGNYTCAVWITTDKGKSTEPKFLDFKINSKIGDFAKLKSDVESARQGDTVIVPAGIYMATEKISVSQKQVKVVAAGNVVINGENCTAGVFDIGRSGVMIAGIEFENCTNSNNGGAINLNNNYHGFVATNCIFRNCAAKMGGAIGGSCYYGEYGAESSDGIPARGELGVITDCSFIDCASIGTSAGTDGSGGGAISGAFWIENSTFEGGASTFYTPGIYSGFNLMVTNCTFKKIAPAASSTRGVVFMARNNTEVKVLDCTFVDTTCQPLVGVSSDKMLVDRCVFENCTGAETKPNDMSGDMSFTYGAGTIRNSLICKNMNPLQLGNLVLENCTIVDNVGGLFVKYNTGNPSPVFTNCVWARNTKWEGGGYTTWGGPGLNWHGGDADAYKRMTFSHCALEGAAKIDNMKILFGQDPTGTTKTLSETLDEKGPKFTDPENGDYTLKSGSPLLNVGVFCDWMTGAKDLAGNPRAKDGKVDLGCYERKATGMLVILR